MNQRDRNRREFANTGMLEFIDLFKREFGAKVLGAVNDETGYAVGGDLGPEPVATALKKPEAV